MRIVLLCFVLLLSWQFEAKAAQDFSAIWSDSMSLMSKGMELVAQGKDDKERTLSEIITFRDSKFQRLLNQCFEILADSETLDLLHKRNKLLKKIQRNNQKIVELQKEYIGAPEEHWNPLKATKKSITSRIKSLKEENKALEQDIQKAKQDTQAAINARGIPITQEQIETLLTAADGEDTASIMAVAENVKQIQGKIEELAQAPDSSIELLKTYTGIYMMCHKVYAYAIEHALEQIQKVYLKKLKSLQAEAQELLGNARKMVRDVSEADRKILETNIQANQRTLEVINLYTRYMQNQARNLERLQAQAEKSAAVAVNTYRTVKTSTELLNMVRASYNEFAQIFSFEPPNLSLLYDARLRTEFEQITNKIRFDN
ncbi:MAG: hypothetical protein IJU79_02075 [Desulfovibrionaceae bacterium]|nr:hypothetical protein [Desulfovibrionaceae bacterium]